MSDDKKLFRANWAQVEMFECDPSKLINFLEEIEFLETFVTEDNKESAEGQRTILPGPNR